MTAAARHVARVVTAVLCSGFALTALASCGGGNGQLSVDVSGNSGPFKPGDTPTFTVKVTNHGPGDAPGVSVRVDMPGAWRYKSYQLNPQSFGAARTQPVDAQVGVADPQWGAWDLAAPNPSAGADNAFATLIIDFVAEVGGNPDSYTLTGHAQGDNTQGSVSSAPLSVNVSAAPKLSLIATVSPTALKGNSVATYRVTITNSGDGKANDISVLITLPPVMGFEQSVMPFSGNGTRTNPIDPVRNSVEVFYGGFVLPPDSSAGPGIVTIVFKAVVTAKPAAGRYPLSIQVTDTGTAAAVDDVVYLVNAAPVSISGTSPSASSGPSPSPSPTPGE